MGGRRGKGLEELNRVDKVLQVLEDDGGLIRLEKWNCLRRVIKNPTRMEDVNVRRRGHYDDDDDQLSSVKLFVPRYLKSLTEQVPPLRSLSTHRVLGPIPDPYL